MPSYIVHIMLGEVELQCRIEAANSKLAADKAVSHLPELNKDNPARQEFEKFVKARHKGTIKVKVEETGPLPPIREGRFKLQPSQKKAGWWVATDTDNLVVVTFEEHNFHKTQHIVPLEEKTPEPLALATSLREMADWLREKHYNLIF
ncbi:MAG: hypothetical protein IJ767_04045 [Bacteroidaceae bacterium]|nr:hypothetical protein [Bacteroidaceae bacterium]